jgi:predicted secreted protein
MISLMLAVAAMSASPADSSASDPRDEQRICRGTRVTGSRLRVTRTCLTRRQWDEQEEENRRDQDRLQQEQRGGFVTPSGDPTL